MSSFLPYLSLAKAAMAEPSQKKQKRAPPTFLWALIILSFERSLIMRREMDPTTVTILIGPNSKPFHVHRDLLVKRSFYCRAVFERQFRGAQGGVLNLQEVEEESFRAYMHWLYTGGLGEQEDEEEGDEAMTREAQREFMHRLTALYVVAVRLDTPGLRNQIVDAVIDLYEDDDDFPDTAVLRGVFSVLPDDSKVGQFLLEISAHCYDAEYAGQRERRGWGPRPSATEGSRTAVPCKP